MGVEKNHSISTADLKKTFLNLRPIAGSALVDSLLDDLASMGISLEDDNRVYSLSEIERAFAELVKDATPLLMRRLAQNDNKDQDLTAKQDE